MNSPLEQGENQQPGGPAPWLFGIWALVTVLWFAFAFAPAPDKGVNWLKIAQIACFGTQDDGLPSDWGWVVMILAPLSMLAGLSAAYAYELRDWAAANKNSALAALAMLATLALVEGRWIHARIQGAGETFNAFQTAPGPEALPDNYPRLDEALPHFELIDQNGQKRGPASLTGAPTLVTFIYANCATVCPFIVRDALKGVAAAPGSRAIFITLDPWRDTPLALPGIARRYGLGPESILLSGEPRVVVAALKKLGIATLRDPLTGEIQHPPLVLLLDERGRIAYRFNRPAPAWIAEAVRRLKKKA